jgi:hypothetical protein
VTEFYFTRRFEHFMAGGTRFRYVPAARATQLVCAGPGASTDARSETLGKPVVFCSSVRRRAIELFGREVDPGCDYVLSEVVHCKSRSEQGVREALPTCTERYLARVIAASAARIIVLLGVTARLAFQDVLHVALPDAAINDGSTGWEYRHPWGPAKLLGRERYVVTLPHPNARGVPKAIEAHYGSDHLSDLQRVLIGAGSWV